MSYIALLSIAACGAGIGQISTDPGHDLDSSSETGDFSTNETASAKFVAGQTGTWNYTTHQVENVQNLENVAFTLNDPEATSGFTEAQIDVSVGNWKASYSYTMGEVTFTGDVTQDMEESTDFTGELDTVEGLEGTRLSCDGTAYSDPFTTMFEADDAGIYVEKLATFYINGPLFTNDDEGEYAILGDHTFNFAGYNSNVGDFYIECTFR